MDRPAPLLSVCIPTYQRAGLVGETVASVLAQAPPEVELLVSDNASTDGTEAAVAAAAGGDPRVRYRRLPENVGAERNFVAAVAAARGEFCWLLGSDDHAAPGALGALLPHLGAGVDVVLFDRVNLDREMRAVVSADRFLDAPDGARFHCGDPAALERFLRSPRSLGGLFSYISSFVVRRSAWSAAPDRPQFLGSAYHHAARVLDVLAAGGRLLYLARPLVRNRTENDSWAATHGIGRRRRADYHFADIAAAVFADRPAARELVVRVLERDVFRLVQLLWDKRMACAAGGGAELAALREGYATLRGRPGWRAKMLAFEAAPPLALELAFHLAAPLARALRRPRARPGRSASPGREELAQP